MNSIPSKTLLIIGAVMAALITGVALGYFFSQRSEAPDAAAAPAASADRKVLYWRDPMVPGAKFDRPGKSPFMDMDLAPVYAHQRSDTAVRINPNMMQNLGVRLGRVERKPLDGGFDAAGSVAFDERLLAVVQARVTGYVTRLYVKAPLTRVKRAQPLLEILSPEWQAAQQDYLALLDAPPSMQAIREAARQRLTVLGVPEATISAIERTRRTDPTTTLSAPISGVVSELAVREGSTFVAGDSLVRINGLASVWANAQVPEAQVSLVSAGAHVSARATAWPAAEFHGRVIALLPDVDLQTRTLAVRVAIDNTGEKLAPGMFVSLAFPAADVQTQLVVPSEAIITTGSRTAVIVASNGGFDVVEVQTGREAGGYTVILAGLEAQQSIVRSGQFLIDSEASLKAVIERLSAAPEPPEPPGPRDQGANEQVHH